MAGLDRCGKSRPHRDSIPGPSSPKPVAIPGPRAIPKTRHYSEHVFKRQSGATLLVTGCPNRRDFTWHLSNSKTAFTRTTILHKPKVYKPQTTRVVWHNDFAGRPWISTVSLSTSCTVLVFILGTAVARVIAECCYSGPAAGGKSNCSSTVAVALPLKMCRLKGSVNSSGFGSHLPLRVRQLSGSYERGLMGLAVSNHFPPISCG